MSLTPSHIVSVIFVTYAMLWSSWRHSCAQIPMLVSFPGQSRMAARTLVSLASCQLFCLPLTAQQTKERTFKYTWCTCWSDTSACMVLHACVA